MWIINTTVDQCDRYATGVNVRRPCTLANMLVPGTRVTSISCNQVYGREYMYISIRCLHTELGDVDTDLHVAAHAPCDWITWGSPDTGGGWCTLEDELFCLFHASEEWKESMGHRFLIIW